MNTFIKIAWIALKNLMNILTNVLSILKFEFL